MLISLCKDIKWLLRTVGAMSYGLGVESIGVTITVDQVYFIVGGIGSRG